jgi:hypothetical protein
MPIKTEYQRNPTPLSEGSGNRAATGSADQPDFHPPPPPHRRAAELNAARWFSFVILAIAVILGAAVRFHRLGLQDMSGDEGAAWAGARGSTISQVVQLQQQLDPGKLALYDVILHEWIAAFGDRLSTLRAMSAEISTISIILVFLVIREICDAFAEPSEADTGEVAGAFGALIFATNLTMVDVGRTARMYSLMVAAELVHILFFVRAQRGGGIANYALSAVFLALAIASNFSAIFVLAGEVLWLGYVFLARQTGIRGADLRLIGPALSLAGGLAILAPFAASATTLSAAALHAGFLDWIRERSLAWPYVTLRNSVGNRWLFRLFLVMAAFGIWRQWERARLVPLFVGAWLAGPFVAVILVTWIITPLMVWRYVVFAFVAFFALAAMGAGSLRTTLARAIAALLVLGLAGGALVTYFRSPREADWKHAVAVAATIDPPGGQIAVVPAFAVNVVRYYLPEQRRGSAVGLDFGCGTQRVLLLSGRSYLPSSVVAPLEHCYPHVVRALRQVEVRSR